MSDIKKIQGRGIFSFSQSKRLNEASVRNLEVSTYQSTSIYATVLYFFCISHDGILFPCIAMQHTV
jgi:hypothetical protein